MAAPHRPAVVWHAAAVPAPTAVAYDPEAKTLLAAGPVGVRRFAAAGPADPLPVPGPVHAVRVHKGAVYAVGPGTLSVLDPNAPNPRTVPMPAERLTGVAVGTDGTVYLTEPDAGRVWAVAGDNATVVADGLDRPTAVLAVCNLLFVAARDGVFSLQPKAGTRTPLTRTPVGELAGLDRDERCNLLAADRNSGNVYQIGPRGDVTLLVGGLSAPGGVAFVPDKRWLVVPTADGVTAFDLTRLRG